MHNLCIHIYVYVPGIHSLELQKKATLIAVPKLRSTPLPPPPVAGCLAWPALLPPSLSHPSRPASVWIKLLGFLPLCSLASEQGMQDSGGRNLLLSVRWLCSPCTCQKGCPAGRPLEVAAQHCCSQEPGFSILHPKLQLPWTASHGQGSPHPALGLLKTQPASSGAQRKEEAYLLVERYLWGP